MAGVIDANGQQWERCCHCMKFVKIETLWYEEPSDKFKHGRDICAECAGGNLIFGMPKLCGRLVSPAGGLR